METQAKTALASSLVAEYWRVEDVVDRPVAASNFMLEVIITAEDGRYSTDEKQLAKFHAMGLLYQTSLKYVLKSELPYRKIFVCALL